MTKMQIVLPFILLIQLSVPVFAESSHCFKNQSEHDAIKSQLPKILQEVPFYLAVENAKVLFKNVSAVGSMQFVEGVMRFYFNATAGMDEPFLPPVNVCASDSEIKITFPNKTSAVFKVLGDSEVSAKYNVKMAKVTKDVFNRISKSVNSVTASSSSGGKTDSSGEGTQ